MEDCGLTDFPDQLVPKKNVGAALTLSRGLSQAWNSLENGFFMKGTSLS